MLTQDVVDGERKPPLPLLVVMGIVVLTRRRPQEVRLGLDLGLRLGGPIVGGGGGAVPGQKGHVEGEG